MSEKDRLERMWGAPAAPAAEPKLPPMPKPDLGSILVGREEVSLGHSDEALHSYARLAVAEALAEVSKDAARYRWLRDQLHDQALTRVYALPIVWHVDYPGEAGNSMDAAIDAALKGSP